MNLDVNQWALIVSAASLLVALLVVPAVRRPFTLSWSKLAQLAGTDLRRYRGWFEQHHGKLKNIYLDRRETLSLRDTYVPLAGYKANETERVSATDVLHDPESTRIIVLGDPGSGKSTLLRAFGTALVSRSRPKSGLPFEGSLPHTPVLVSLRAFAGYLESDRTSGRSLHSFIQDEILKRGAKVRQPARLLTGLLDDEKLLLLLDGLDEVPDALVREVRTEVLRFIESHGLRAVLTCRRQNFLTVRTDWVPGFTDRTYTLAPLRDDEVVAFIHRRQKDFTPPRSPSDLFQSINQSGTLELHRVPMILTVSIALYIHLTGYRIPTSLSRFYEEMIKQLLTRHDFRLEHSGSVNRFSAEDKLRFLREFSYQTAVATGRLEDFPREKLVAAAEKLTDRLTTVHRGEGEHFVDELINRSGLIAQASLETEYAFAHRSIQEYLIASRLLGDPQAGAEFLLTMADDPEWRLVAIFFASFDHNYVEYFLRNLRTRNLELCGHCMATATIADRALAADTIAALRDRVTHNPPLPDRSASFAALTTLANAPQPWLRETAVGALLVCLETTATTGEDVSTFFSLDKEAIAQVLHGLAGVTGREVLNTVARLAGLPMAGSLRNIQPLWARYWPELAEPNPDQVILSAMTDRLLQLCETVEGLRELQSQPPPPTTPELQAAVASAYPFSHGLAQDSNLPLLLAVLQTYQIEGYTTRPFVRAVATRDPHLTTLERDHRRRAKRIFPFRPMRIAMIAAYAASALLIIAAVLGDGWRALYYNAHSLSLDDCYYLLPGFLGSTAAFIAASVSARRYNATIASDLARGLLRLPWIGASRQSFMLDPRPDQTHKLWREHSGFVVHPANPIVRQLDDVFDFLGTDGRFTMDIIGSPIGVALANLITLPVAVGIHTATGPRPVLLTVVAAVAIFVTFWLPATYLCARGVAIDLRRRNPLLGAYSDPATAHWLRPMA